jgi:hypothetical protein
MRPSARDRGMMVRVGLIVIAIAAAAFALNLFLFDSAGSTGSAGRLSPRADDLPLRTVTTEPSAGRTAAAGRARTAPATPGHATTAAAPAVAPRTTTDDDDDDRGSDDRGSDDRSDDSSDDGDSDDDGGRGRGRGRSGGEDD